MATKKYPIGTKIRFIYDNFDKGKIGTIVGIRDEYPLVFLPTGSGSLVRYKGIDYSWKCLWSHIEYVGQRQLLFEFMYDA